MSIIYLLLVYILRLIIHRIEIRQHLRRLGDHPSDADQQKLENLRVSLAPMLTELTNYQLATGIHSATAFPSTHTQDTLGDDGPAMAPALAQDATVPIEQHQFVLPSDGGFALIYQHIELNLHIAHAKTHLNQLRDLIAESPFNMLMSFVGHQPRVSTPVAAFG